MLPGQINYLRVSITDRCNLRCFYCTPWGGWQKLPSQEILSYEELLRLAGVAAGAQAIIFFVAIILAILAPIAARLVQLAVSRQREYLADASSVELTRYPAGLERALVVIAADQEPLEVANRATQHLYIVNPVKKLSDRQMGLFSTHPPILDRVNRLRAMTGEPPMTSEAMLRIKGLE